MIRIDKHLLQFNLPKRFTPLSLHPISVAITVFDVHFYLAASRIGLFPLPSTEYRDKGRSIYTVHKYERG